MASTATILLLLALFIAPAISYDCPADRQNNNQNEEGRLESDLLCAYPMLRPVKDYKKTVNIKVRFALKYITFDYLEETITVHSWVAMTWKDDFLSWNKADYSGIDEIQLSSSKIWTPKMALFNADATTFSNNDDIFTDCSISDAGAVTCVPHIAYSALCSSQIRRWPYDQQTCTLYFGSWMYAGEQVNFTFYDKHPVTRDDYHDGPGWKLLNVTYKRLPGKYTLLNATYPMLKYNFVLAREAAGPAAIIVVPAVVIVLLTLISLLLDIKDYTRLFLVCFSLFGHFIFLTEIGNMIPKHSTDTPVILFFIRDSMVITLSGIILTLGLMSLRQLKTPAPAFVATVVRLMDKGPVKYAVFTEFDPSTVEKANLTDEEPKENDISWIQVANIINSVVFIIFSITYIILFSKYLPSDT